MIGLVYLEERGRTPAGKAPIVGLDQGHQEKGVPASPAGQGKKRCKANRCEIAGVFKGRYCRQLRQQKQWLEWEVGATSCLQLIVTHVSRECGTAKWEVEAFECNA